MVTRDKLITLPYNLNFQKLEFTTFYHLPKINNFIPYKSCFCFHLFIEITPLGQYAVHKKLLKKYNSPLYKILNSYKSISTFYRSNTSVNACKVTPFQSFIICSIKMFMFYHDTSMKKNLREYPRNSKKVKSPQF